MTREQLRAYQYWALMNGFKPKPVKWGWNHWKTR